MRQIGLNFRRRAKGGGRKPNGPKAGISHLRRPGFASKFPVHVTLRMRAHVYNLRSQRCYQPIQRAFDAAKDKFGFRLNHFSVQGNHIHLIGEAQDRLALAKAVQALSVRIARALNKVMQRRGKVFADRYHAHVLRTPTEVRHALRYVLGNFEKHSAEWGKPLKVGYRDPYSSISGTSSKSREGTGPPI